MGFNSAFKGLNLNIIKYLTYKNCQIWLSVDCALW